MHQKATRFGKLPSEIVGLTDEWAAYQLDNAVNFFGITVENALAERDKVGQGANVEYRDRYTLAQLLHPDFRLPRPAQGNSAGTGQEGGAIAQILALAGQPRSGVKKFTYVGPQSGLRQ